MPSPLPPLAPRREEAGAEMSSALSHYENCVCVVIAGDDVSEADVRQSLGDWLPIRLASWNHRAYQAVIRSLRPQVIVVVADSADLAWDCGRLVACLFSRFEPTVVSATLAAHAAEPPRLVVHQLGTSAQVEIASLRNVVFTG